MNPERFKKIVLALIIIFIISSVIGIILILKPEEEIKYNYSVNGDDSQFELKKVKCNEYRIKTPEKYDLPTLYHNQYIDYILNDFDKAWELVPQKIKEKYHNKKEEYRKFCNGIVHKNSNEQIVRFSRSNSDKGTLYVTVDKYDVKLNIIESGIWKYEAYVSGYAPTRMKDTTKVKK